MSGAEFKSSPPSLARAVLAEAAERMLAVRSAPDDAELAIRTLAWIDADEHHRRAWQLAERAWAASGDGLLTPARPANRNRRLRHVVAIAACLIALVAAPRAFDTLRADVVTEHGERTSQTLSDGSHVTLAGGSAIDTRFNPDVRRVALLRGAVYFDIRRAPERPFIVNADAVTITVHGTAFDVAVGGDTIAVAVSHGTVAVSVGEDKVELRKGERFDYRRDSRTFTVEPIAPDDVALWRQGRLAVSNVPLGEVLDALMRQNGGYIVASRDLRARRVTGVFDLADTGRALSALLAPQGADAVGIGAGIWWLRQRAAPFSQKTKNS